MTGMSHPVAKTRFGLPIRIRCWMLDASAGELRFLCARHGAEAGPRAFPGDQTGDRTNPGRNGTRALRGVSVTTDASRKVTAPHLARDAYLYVRQSSLRQVMENTESTKRQYDLRRRAIALGWSDQRPS